jgi:hypothetical protein
MAAFLFTIPFLVTFHATSLYAIFFFETETSSLNNLIINIYNLNRFAYYRDILRDTPQSVQGKAQVEPGIYYSSLSRIFVLVSLIISVLPPSTVRQYTSTDLCS